MGREGARRGSTGHTRVKDPDSGPVQRPPPLLLDNLWFTCLTLPPRDNAVSFVLFSFFLPRYYERESFSSTSLILIDRNISQDRRVLYIRVARGGGKGNEIEICCNNSGFLPLRNYYFFGISEFHIQFHAKFGRILFFCYGCYIGYLICVLIDGNWKCINGEIYRQREKFTNK